MKKKYYLRGLGVGVLITAVIFSIALFFYQPAMSEDEIRTEAAKLGMVDPNSTDSTIADSKNSDSSDSSDDSSQTDGSEDSTTVTTKTGDDVSDDNVNPQGKTTSDSSSSTDARTTEASSSSSDGSHMVTVTISGGQSSNVVGNTLYQAGVVDDAAKFNEYLEQNGYDNSIQPGSYQLAKGSTYEQVAHAITSK